MAESIKEHARRAFRDRFGRWPRWLASAPGRVNLIGEHTDYNDGFVLPIAIELRTMIAAAPNERMQIRMRSEVAGETAIIDLSRPLKPEPRGCWVNYPLGVVAGFQEAGYRPRGFDALITSNVPLGGGLSSSAALECATAALLEAVCEITLDPTRKALLCQLAENTYPEVPCGIMDPFICTLAREGKAMLLDCRSREPQWLSFSDPAIAVLIINTNVKHELSRSEYPRRRAECAAAARDLGVRTLRDACEQGFAHDDPHLRGTLLRRARHVTSEIQRTLRAADCISRRDGGRLGQLLNESHASLRDDFEVSCKELDALVDIANEIGPGRGVLGCRMTGGGFGGCAVALIEAEHRERIIELIGRRYSEQTGIAASFYTSRAAEGARLEPAGAKD